MSLFSYIFAQTLIRKITRKWFMCRLRICTSMRLKRLFFFTNSENETFRCTYVPRHTTKYNINFWVYFQYIYKFKIKSVFRTHTHTQSMEWFEWYDRSISMLEDHKFLIKLLIYCRLSRIYCQNEEEVVVVVVGAAYEAKNVY